MALGNNMKKSYTDKDSLKLKNYNFSGTVFNTKSNESFEEKYEKFVLKEDSNKRILAAKLLSGTLVI